jgi:hypothetical protein
MRARSLLALLAALSFGIPVVAQNPVCALSDKQEQDAPAAFEKLVPLFLTKRCFNCHGGINPFVGMTMGKQSKKLETRGEHPELFDGEDKVVLDDNGDEDVAKTFKSCSTCHDQGFADGKWRLAPFAPDKQFAVGGGGIPKLSIDLCKQVKVQGRVQGAAGFIGHMTDDNGDMSAPFLKTAFAGTMALNPEQTDRSELRKSEGGYYKGLGRRYGRQVPLAG